MSYKQRVDVNSLLGINGLGVLVRGADAINNSIYNILSCLLGTRAYQPLYGSMLPHYIWDQVNVATAQKIRIAAIQALENYEPDILLDISRTRIEPLSTGTGYDVTIAYVLREDNTTGNARFAFDRGN
jgi:phage baseplate assembly protein W